MIRRLKKDVLKELPPKLRRSVMFKLSKAAYREYNKAQDDFIGWLRKQSPVRAKRAAKNKALTKVGYMLRLVARLKLEWTTKWIEEFFIANPGKKLVCFTMHTFVIDHLKAKFGARAVIVDGRVRGRKRAETVRKFQSNRKCDLFLGQWVAAGVGITLTSAHHVAALDFPWTPADLIQGEDRIHRIGQKLKCIIHYLAALGTIEEKQIKIQLRKSKILDAILNGQRKSKDLDIFRELLREMRMI
jgi:SWI/SNF-related matrix-associated actin-dependent regulator 1 of chromatin subfamily A